MKRSRVGRLSLVVALSILTGNLGSASTLLTEPTCPAVGTIGSNFNGTAIAENNFIWFNSVLKVSNLPAGPATIFLDNSTITFAANGTNYNLPVPAASVTFDPNALSATTTFDTVSNRWVTVIPTGVAGKNAFLSGLTFLVPSGGLRGGANPVTWQGTFTTDSPGVTLNWQWAAAVYTSFTDYNVIGVKPTDDNQASQYQNSDHAGTPEHYKNFVVGGARGGGGSNYTGSMSSTGSVTPCKAMPTATATPTRTFTNTPTNTP